LWHKKGNIDGKLRTWVLMLGGSFSISLFEDVSLH